MQAGITVKHVSRGTRVEASHQGHSGRSGVAPVTIAGDAGGGLECTPTGTARRVPGYQEAR